MMSYISVFGGANVDIIGVPEKNVRMRDSNVGRVIVRPGGVGRNIAEQLVKNGKKCRFFSVFGSDYFSAFLKDSCMQKGIDISGALSAEENSGIYLCIHDETGDMVAAVNDMDLMQKMNIEYAESCLPAINRSEICILDANPPAETILFIAEHSKIPLLMDPVSCAKANRALPVLPYLTAIKPNIYEARMMTGCHDAKECARKLIDKGVRNAFVSLGIEGLCFADHDTCGIIAPEHVYPGPSNGAGDALCAGLAIALANGYNVKKCAEYGMSLVSEYMKTV